MKSFSFGRRSREKLDTVKIQLQHVARLALYLSPVDFGITEGIRSLERQKSLVAAGKSRTLKSRHLIGEAIDIVPYVNGKFTYENEDAFKTIITSFFLAAAILGETITSGSDWDHDGDTEDEDFLDWCHIQIESAK